MSKDEALRLALEALEAIRFTGDIVIVVTAEHGPVYLDHPIAAIREALAQPEPEPVAYAAIVDGMIVQTAARKTPRSGTND